MQVLTDEERSLIHSALPNTSCLLNVFVMKIRPWMIQPALPLSNKLDFSLFLRWWVASSWRWVPCAEPFSSNFYSQDESLCAVWMHQCYLDTDFLAEWQRLCLFSKQVPIHVYINLHCTWQSWFAHSDIEDKHILLFWKIPSFERRSLYIVLPA